MLILKLPRRLDEAFRPPAPRGAVRTRARIDQDGIAGDVQVPPALRSPPFFFGANAQLEPRLARMPRPEHTDEIKQIIDLVAPAEPAVLSTVRQKPAPA